MTTQYKYLLKTHKNRSTFDPSGRPMKNDIRPEIGSCCCGAAFTRLASEHFLKVRGNTRVQVGFLKRSDLPQPCGPSTNAIAPRRPDAGPCCHPWERGAHGTVGPRLGASRSCDSARGGGMALPFALSGSGCGPAGC